MVEGAPYIVTLSHYVRVAKKEEAAWRAAKGGAGRKEGARPLVGWHKATLTKVKSATSLLPRTQGRNRTGVGREPLHSNS